MTNAILRAKPDAGNPHVRFDEGEVASAKPRRGSLLYKRLICVFGLFAAFAAEASVTLEAGKTDVVIAPMAPDAVLWAAEETANFLSRALGSPVPIMRAPRAGRASVILGENEWSKAAGMDAAKHPRDTYLIRTAGDAVLICGVDETRNFHKRVREHGLEDFQRGTVLGAYAFLERFAGCRFYFPGELGEIVPRAERIVIPDTDLVSTPANLVRKYYSSSADGVVPDEAKASVGPTKNLQWVRLRLATTEVPCCHGTSRMKIRDRFAETHPEYFALKADGTRYNTYTGTPSSRKGQLCFSNPGLRDVIYQECLKRFAKGAAYVDIMPNDAYPGCVCEGCRKLCDMSDGQNYATDLIWDYTVDIARRIKAAGIRGKVTQMAYPPYKRVPAIDIPDNVAVMVAVSGPWAWGDGKKMENDLAPIRAWAGKTGGSVWIWTYPHKYGPLRITGVPDVAPVSWGKYYQAVDDLIFGTFAESETDNWMYHYLNYYVFSRVMWDGKSANVDAIIAEHDRLMFGTAAAEMREFYAILERKWVREVAGNIIETEIGPVASAPTERDLWTRIYSRDVRAKLGSLLETAAAKVRPGSLEARRIAFFRREYYDGLAKGAAESEARMRAVEALRWRPGCGEKVTLNHYHGDKDPKNHVKTTVAARRVGGELVFVFDCEEPLMDEVVAPERVHDDPDMWTDSGVEVFLNPSADRQHLLHLIVNAKGCLWDCSTFKVGRSAWTGAKSDMSWSSNARAKVTPRADGWTTELRIPLASLGEAKEAFPVEFVRSRITKSGRGGGHYKWSTFTDNLMDIGCHGTMVMP